LKRPWTVTDSAHVAVAKEARALFQARTAAMRGLVAAPGSEVGQRALSHYDEVFHLPAPPCPSAHPNLRVVR